jgi:uncharacterized protein YegP (UPF0339 family)
MNKGEGPMAGTFEIYQDHQGEYSFRLRSRNGDVVANGLSFPTRDAAKRGIAAVLRAAAGATIVPEPATIQARCIPPL